MTDMNCYKIILIFLFIPSKGFSQQFDIKSFLMSECEITDTVFLEGLSIFVLSDSVSACFKHKETYVFHLSFDSSQSAFGCNYIVVLQPIGEYSIDSQGVFSIESKIFLIDSSVPRGIYTFSGKKRKLFYKKMRIHDDENRPLVTVQIEEFSIWFLNYSDGIMSVKNKLYVH